MLHTSTQKIIESFTEADLKFDIGESEAASSVRCVIKGKNMEIMQLLFFSFHNTEGSSAICPAIAQLTEDKLTDALALANEFNNTYPVKTTIDKDLNVRVIADIPAGVDDDIGKAALKMLRSLPIIIDGAIYPKFAELLNRGETE